MRILADENISQRSVEILRNSGHDVRWATETNRRAPDPDLLELATREGRTLITYDSDFGELVHRTRTPAPFGIVFFRLHNLIPDEVKSALVASAISAWDSWPPGLWTFQVRHQPNPA